MLRAGVEPASCRLGVDNRTRSGPQQQISSRSWRAVGLRSRTAAAQVQNLEPLFPGDNRAAPARDEAGPPGFEPGPARLELAVLPVTPRTCEADDPDRTGLPGLATRCSSF